VYEYAVQLVRVVDGDTLKLRVDLGFHLWLSATCRLGRVNCPELLEVHGMEARLLVVGELSAAVSLKIVSRRVDKYGRCLAEVLYRRLASDRVWVNLSDLLLERGLAVPYRW